MHIEKLEIENYRNYKFVETSFSKEINIIYGENAQGKTNIIESIFLCASGRSHRTSREIELINVNENWFKVKLNVNRNNEKKIIDYQYKSGKKVIMINEIPIKKIGNLMGNLLAVFFSPEDILIIKEGPSLRRRFVDITLSQLKPSYFYNLQQYNRILLQRNNLLKEIQKNKSLIETMEVWDEKICEVASKIVKERSIFIKRLNEISKQKHYKLTRNSEELEIIYRSSLDETNFEDVDDIEKQMLSKLKKNRSYELNRCTTLIGPHRDDYEIMINGMKIKNFGSQGQQRTAILSLKLSEIEIIKSETDEYPILLLDDVMSELDNKRREFLFESIQGIQTFITCTERDFYRKKEFNDIMYLNIKKGKLYKE